MANTLLTKTSLKTRIRPRLRIALQKRGRLNEPSLAFLVSRGIKFAPSGSSLIQQCDNFELDILYLRDDDIPEFVSRGVADFGIVGQNVLLEQNKNVRSVQKLDFGRCRLSIASPAHVPVKTAGDLNGLRIATTYPCLLKKYLQEQKVTATIVEIGGSAEIAPELNLADVICDIVQTGTTLKAHNLQEVLTILDSQAVLIASERDTAQKRGFINLCSRTYYENI